MGNPYISGLPWAGGTYPAGVYPWNGQPMDVAPVNNYFTPNVPIPAEDLNYILNQRDQALLYMNRFARDDTKYVIAGAGSVAATTGSGWGVPTGYSVGNSVQQAGISISSLVGDIIEVSFSGSMQWNGAGGIGQANLRLEGCDNSGAATAAGFGATSVDAVVKQGGTAQLFWLPVSLLGTWTVATAGINLFFLNGHVTNFGSASDWSLLSGVYRWKQLRAT